MALADPEKLPTLHLKVRTSCCISGSTAQHSTAQHSTAQHSTAQHSTAQHSTAQPSPAQPSTGCCSAAHSICRVSDEGQCPPSAVLGRKPRPCTVPTASMWPSAALKRMQHMLMAASLLSSSMTLAVSRVEGSTIRRQEAQFVGSPLGGPHCASCSLCSSLSSGPCTQSHTAMQQQRSKTREEKQHHT